MPINFNMKKQENNYPFIDSNNLNLAIKDCGWNLDFAIFFIYWIYGGE